MREYKIIRSTLWYNIYKKKEENWRISVRFLYWHENRWLNRAYAKNFYNRDDAVSALALVKHKNEKKSD